MKIKIRPSDDQFVIYREKSGVIIFAIFLALVCIAFGASFVCVGKEELFPTVLGSIFIIVGTLLLLGSPKYYKKMKKDDGVVLLANMKGISIAPLLDMTLVNYSWANVSRILLTKKLIIKETGEKSYSWNQAIVFFRGGVSSGNVGLMERSKKQIWKSPKGYNVSVFDIPKEEIDAVKEALIRFSSNNSEVYFFSSVCFDYVENSEKFRP